MFLSRNIIGLELVSSVPFRIVGLGAGLGFYERASGWKMDEGVQGVGAKVLSQRLSLPAYPQKTNGAAWLHLGVVSRHGHDQGHICDIAIAEGSRSCVAAAPVLELQVIVATNPPGRAST